MLDVHNKYVPCSRYATVLIRFTGVFVLTGRNGDWISEGQRRVYENRGHAERKRD